MHGQKNIKLPEGIGKTCRNNGKQSTATASPKIQTDEKERPRKTKKKMEGPHSPSKTGTGSIRSTCGG